MPETFEATTRDIRVSVRVFYLNDQSEPDEAKYVWAYRIQIRNQGRAAAQLLHRTWEITDSRGHTMRVHGPGVVGEQPVIEPGEEFEYTSGTPLGTPSGFMVGTYHMIHPATGETFDIAVPAFSLDSPFEGRHVH